MRFRPCIDIHNGKVKQIVGGSLSAGVHGDVVCENFISDKDSTEYAKLFREKGLYGGHVILLDKDPDTKYQAKRALEAFPNGLQVGGGITPENSLEYLDAGASHVIVTSYVFCDGKIDRTRLKSLKDTVGKDRIVLDLSCRRVGDDYMVVTDRWQNITDEKVGVELLEELADSCDEFLIHAADVEGKRGGVELELLSMIAGWEKVPITYAGGVGSLDDIESMLNLCGPNIDVTVGSALDIYGGDLSMEAVIALLS